jgi:hypothetical protein
MATKHMNQDIQGAARLRPGKALVIEVTSRGGIEYEPAEMVEDGDADIKSSRQVIDDRDLNKWVIQTRNYVLNMVRKHAVNTDIGVWFSDTKMLADIEEEIDPYRKIILKINRQARAIKSKRETRCEYWTFPWVHDDIKLRLRMGQLIHSRLHGLREAYTDKRKDRYRVEMDKCRNLHLLVSEPQSSLIRNAVNATANQRPLIIRNYGGTNIPLELLKTPLKKLEFDYSPIDLAMTEFAPASDLFVSELPDLKRLTG